MQGSEDAYASWHALLQCAPCTRPHAHTASRRAVASETGHRALSARCRRGPGHNQSGCPWPQSLCPRRPRPWCRRPSEGPEDCLSTGCRAACLSLIPSARSLVSRVFPPQRCCRVAAGRLIDGESVERQFCFVQNTARFPCPAHVGVLDVSQCLFTMFLTCCWTCELDHSLQAHDAPRCAHSSTTCLR